MPNSLSKIYDAAMGRDLAALTPAVPAARNLRDYAMMHWLRPRASEGFSKSVSMRVDEAFHAQMVAGTQGSVVNAGLMAMGVYDSARGVREPTSLTFETLRQMAHHCEPVAAIINRQCLKGSAFGQLPDMRRGMNKKPGFRIKMRHKSEKTTDADKRDMARLEEFILDGGFCDPPRDERSANWQPGFPNFISAILRDRLTYDWVAIRRWPVEGQSQEVGPLSLACFAAIDAGLIRRVHRPFLRLDDGVAVTSDWEGERTNTTREIHYVKVESGNTGGIWSNEFTLDELAVAHGCPITDETRNGYGYGELERCLNAITIWIASREYNSSRFNNDSLPRGILAILSAVNSQQFDSFKYQWQSMLTGNGKRWFNPIIQGATGQGAAVNWIPIDQSTRDMEYHQFMFSVALWMHAMFSIHPEETGYESLSPFKSTLSEPSPESKLNQSQSAGFEPLMRWLADLLNREIIWRLVPSRRYMLEWVGLVEGDEMADVELYTAMLEAGLTTPRRALTERDEPIPEALEDDPAMDMLGTWAANKTLVMQMEQTEQQQEQAKQQQAQQAEARHQQGQMQQMQATTQRAAQFQAQSQGNGGPPRNGNGATPMPQELVKAMIDPWLG